jgi:hypothetical protein
VLDLKDKSQMQAEAGSVNSAARICLDSPIETKICFDVFRPGQSFKSELDFHGSSSTEPHHIILTLEGQQTPFWYIAKIQDGPGV